MLLAEDDWLEYDLSSALLVEGKSLATFKGHVVHKDIQATVQHAADPAADRERRRIAQQATQRSLKTRQAVWSGALKVILHRFLDGKISKPLAEKLLKRQLKSAHRDAYVLGAKSAGLRLPHEKLTPEEERYLKSIYAHEMRYFSKFLAAMQPEASKAGLERRIDAYVKTTTSIYDNARVLGMPLNTIIHWVLGFAEHCPDCELLRRYSPYTKHTLPTTPRAGSTRCLTNCKCRLVVRFVEPAEVERVGNQNLSRKSTLEYLRRQRKG